MPCHKLLNKVCSCFFPGDSESDTMAAAAAAAAAAAREMEKSSIASKHFSRASFALPHLPPRSGCTSKFFIKELFSKKFLTKLLSCPLKNIQRHACTYKVRENHVFRIYFPGPPLLPPDHNQQDRGVEQLLVGREPVLPRSPM